MTTIVRIKKPQPPSMEELKKQINDAGGILTVTMGYLRKAANYEKLGKNVNTDIANQLRDHKIGYLGELGLSQDLEVRVYAEDHPLGALVDAVLNPTVTGDQLLIEAAGNDAAELLGRIRSMLRPPAK